MIIIIWCLLALIFIACGVFLALYLTRQVSAREAFQTLWNGFKEGLKGSGFLFTKHRYPVELYKWSLADEETVCDVCYEMSTWPPMDLADWMKEDLPKSANGHTQCGRDCQCELVLCKPHQINQKY